jgi:IS30 family transposase
MKTYTHLTQDERDRIAVLRNRGQTWRDIGLVLGRDHSALIREWNRNRPRRGPREYLPHKAQQRAEFRRENSHKRPRLKSRVLRFEVERHLLLKWSPELIAGRFKRFRPDLPCISAEAIYQWIYTEAPHLIGTLLRSHPRRRRRSHRPKGKKVIIPHRVSIRERPPQAQERREPGHWESDLMIGRGGRSALQTSVERVSRYTKITKVANKTARCCRQALDASLRPLPPHLRRSVTYDNGTENAEHHLLNQELGTHSYFCEPYHSWEKGSVENRNGVIRRPFPKRTNFDTISPSEIQKVEDEINTRPMKCLDYKTPAEVLTSFGAITG